MRTVLSAALAAAFLFSSGAIADDADTDTEKSKPIELTAEQMDNITAGDLLLPNGNIQFAGFDNPSGAGPFEGLFHPSFGRSASAVEATSTQTLAGHGPYGTSPEAGNEGPWSAAASSPVISCLDTFGYGFGGICTIP